jgi:hypothetical protein
MLRDVEEQLTKLDHLPTERVTFEVPTNLRPPEIQGVIRARYFPSARSCYEDLTRRQPAAQGKVTLRFVITVAGALTELELDTEGSLDDAAFLGCMTGAADAVAFPPSGEKTTVRYPIVFTPN